MSSENTGGAPRRIAIAPDPAWDWYEEEDGVLAVELSWMPDALAGRAPDFVAGPELIEAMSAAGLTGYRTGAARGYFGEQVVDVEEGTPPPPLVRLLVDDDPAADFAYERGQGLTVTERALAVLQAHCRNLTVQPAG